MSWKHTPLLSSHAHSQASTRVFEMVTLYPADWVSWKLFTYWKDTVDVRNMVQALILPLSFCATPDNLLKLSRLLFLHL
jgi:hypothetical protein